MSISGVKDFTIKKDFEAFVSMSYPKLDPKSQQYRHLKRAWYAATFSLFGFLVNLPDSFTSEEQEAEKLSALRDETVEWIRNDLRALGVNTDGIE